jgi:hypothetical protein
LTALDLEREAAAAPPLAKSVPAPEGEAMAMLVRRGLRPMRSRPDLPFPAELDEASAARISEQLDRYAFRLFLRAAILSRSPFEPASLTRYLSLTQACAMADSLVELGLAVRTSSGAYRLIHPAKSFGGTLEWYFARELSRRLGFSVASGLKLRGGGTGGDLDVVAAAEGKLVYVELKSSPPKYLTPAEASAFFDRVRTLRPDISIFAIDTALRISDKVVPILTAVLERAGPQPKPARIQRELWSLTPHIYLINAKPDLVGNAGRAIAEGLRALAPAAP